MWLDKNMSVISPILHTCDNKVIDYAICTKNFSNKISTQVLFADDNPSDHDIILIQIDDNEEHYTRPFQIPPQKYTSTSFFDKSRGLRLFILVILSLLVYRWFQK